MTTIQPIDSTNQTFRTALISLWNAACGPDWLISEALADFNTGAATDVLRSAWLAMDAEQPVGFVLSSVWSASPTLGWVDAIVAAPAWQGQGVGAALLAHAEAWLRECGCTRARLGGSLRAFVPGLPLEFGTTDYFRQHGYGGDRIEIDLARSLADYRTPAGVAATNDLRPLATGEAPALLEFFGRAFPGRWEYEAHEHFRAGGPPDDFLALWQNGRVEGFCYTSVPDSFRPLDRFYMHKLPQPWGQLGPLGLSREVRGQGLGVAIIDAALRHLQARGVDGCVIDWTTFVDLYSKFGFAPYHHYTVLIKELAT